MERERGFGLRDLWTDERFDVRERAATRTIPRGSLIAARLLEGEPGEWRMEGGLHVYPAASREEMPETLRAFHADFERSFPAAGRAAFFKRIGFVFHHLWMDHAALAAAEMPTLGTPEGEPMRFVESRFEVVDPDALAIALREHAHPRSRRSIWRRRSVPRTRSGEGVALA